VENFFSPEELDPMVPVLEEYVENVAQRLYKAGKIKGDKTNCFFM